MVWHEQFGVFDRKDRPLVLWDAERDLLATVKLLVSKSYARKKGCFSEHGVCQV